MCVIVYRYLIEVHIKENNYIDKNKLVRTIMLGAQTLIYHVIHAGGNYQPKWRATNVHFVLVSYPKH
jgi:hypothetical protein